jgi:Ca-activated chloride channel family protein
MGLAFQAPYSTEPVVSITPRIRPRVVSATEDVPRADLRTDLSLVLIPAHVTNPLGRSITSLSKDNFHLFEDGAEQPIHSLFHDDAPLSIGLLLDASGSMQNKMPKSVEAAATFFKTANTQDEFFLVEFGDRPKLAIPFTPNSAEIYREVAHTHPFGRTSLLDAVHLAMVQMKNAKHLRKALVILSDGGDNRSRYTAREVKNALLESDVQVYAMGIFDGRTRGRLSREEQNGPTLLGELTEQSGGRFYAVQDLDDLPRISAGISQELRDQYVLAYSPAHPANDGKYHSVQVHLAAPAELPDLKVYFRRGYYSPLE